MGHDGSVLFADSAIKRITLESKPFDGRRAEGRVDFMPGMLALLWEGNSARIKQQVASLTRAQFDSRVIKTWH